MTTTARPLRLGDFDSARPRRPSDNASPPSSARLPPLQIQTSNQWSKNIWGFSGTGGNGFGAVGRPKDSTDDRKSPSLLSPAGPSPWIKSYGLPSPIEPSIGDFGAKRHPVVHSKNAISPTFQSAKQMPQKTLPSIGSLSLRTYGLNGDSRPTETSSARPAFNRLGSRVTSPAEAFESGRQHANSLSSWDPHPTEFASRPANSVVQSAAAEYAPYTERFGYMPAKAADTVADHSVWSSARQPSPASYNIQQGSVKHSSSVRAPLHHDSQCDTEGGFDMVQNGQQAPAHTQRSSDRDAYTLHTQGSTHHELAPLSHAAWDAEYIPRSFVPASALTRQLDSRAHTQAFQDSQYSSDPHRRNADLSQYRLPALTDEYELRQAVASMDPRLRTGYLQLDRKGMLSLQEQDDIMQSFMHAHLRSQYLASLPYNFPGGGHPGASQYMQTMPMQPIIPTSRAGDNHQAMRSQLLDEFLASQKTNLRRFELRDIYDHIVEFSGNQHGSKFIQNKLETATSDEKERVFRELMPNAIQLMKDIYGNYVIQKVIERGDQSQKTALFNVMSGKVYELSCQVYGCRVVQTALQHVLVHQQAAMVDELKNHVLDCVRDQNGNHVIQIVVKHVPAEYTHFVVDAFIGNIKHLATHPYGCRVVQRLLDHCVEPSRSQILHELHACANDLVSDQYGNYVTQHVLEHGCPEDRAKIIALVRQHLIPYSKQKFASNVVEKCLNYGNEEQRREIMLEISAKAPGCESALPLLIKDSFGNYVIQRLLDTLSQRDYAHFVEVLTPEIAALRRMAPNNKQVDNVAKKMYRHDGMYNHQHYHNPALQAMRIDTASSTPALTHDESSPYSTSQPSVVDENTSLHAAKDPRMTDIRIEVTGH